MSIIAAITTKDEEWIIDKTLSVLTKFCDKIVILDDNSSDNTKDICTSFKKVEWHVREKRANIWERKEAEGLYQCFNLAGAHDPEYILMIDADEIPTPSFLNFFNSIDINVNAWSVRMLNLYKDEFHYRTDNFTTAMGANIFHDPFYKQGWRKTVLLKYDPNYEYTYNFSVQKGGTSKNHPSPQNIPSPICDTEDFYMIHYGRINPKYISGEKDELYALIESHDGKGSFKNRLMHHNLCRNGSGPCGPEYKECSKEWFW
jgi:glycosyltransferase involved in cell wall biosynthesis